MKCANTVGRNRSAVRMARAVALAALGLSVLTQGVATAAALAAPADEAPRVLDAGDLERFLDAAVARDLEELRIPGAVVAVVKDGDILFAKGWGYADVESQVPMSAQDTLIRPGSASKPITWTAVMQLVEQGRIDLHADVNEYLDFAIDDSFAEPVTMHHLLTHTAGFEAVEADLFILDPASVPPLGEYVRRHRPVRLFAPGAVPGYSNYGTALAAYIVERVSGEPFNDYLEANIFSPLGMSRTTFRQPVPEHLADDVAQGYGGEDTFVRGDFEYVGPYPAGSASMTAEDMARFMIAHLGERGSAPGLLGDETLSLMHRQQFTPDARLSKMAYGFAEMTVNDRRLLWHGGSTFLHNSGLYLLPEENLGVFIAYNGQRGTIAGGRLLQELMDRYYPSNELTVLRPDPASRERNSRYVGEYHFTRSEFTGSGKFVRLLSAVQVQAPEDGRLLVSVEGVSEPYIELEPGLYRHETRQELLVLETDEGGTVWIYSDGSPSHLGFFVTSAFRVPWYQSSVVTAAVLLLTAVAFLGSATGWGVAALARRLRSRRAPEGTWWRWVALSFGALYGLFLVSLVSTLVNVDPAFGVPRAFLGEEPVVLSAAMWLPVVMAPLAVAMLLAAVSIWRQGDRHRVAERVHCSVLAVLALATTAVLFYWNLYAFAA